MIPIEFPCLTCGWPPGFAVHREDMRSTTFITADGKRPFFVRGHPYVAPAAGAA